MKLSGFLSFIAIIALVGCGASSSNSGSIDIILKSVPAGSFQRDSTATSLSIISISYRMSQNLITRTQFLAIMGADPSNSTYSSGTNDPVQNVNWYQAIAFCNKLSIAEGLTPVYSVTGIDFKALTFASIPTSDNATWDAATANWSANGYRLPTEMEYMWAMMGATSDCITSDIVSGINTGGYLKGYSGSSETGSAQVNINNYAWTSNNSGSTSHPVGSKTPNELGLYDMSGNVFEWTWDGEAPYPLGTQTDYRGASFSDHISRGGCWFNNASFSPVFFRDYQAASLQDYCSGFRVVRQP